MQFLGGQEEEGISTQNEVAHGQDGRLGIHPWKILICCCLKSVTSPVLMTLITRFDFWKLEESRGDSMNIHTNSAEEGKKNSSLWRGDNYLRSSE